jgi:nicotinate-nucleotide adenylyltransferase
VAARRLGVFGGTFDPLHHGHLIVAGEAFEALGLDLLLLVPAAQPPHKPGTAASAEQRLRMLRAATAGDPRFAIEEIELRREGPSYTVDTLRELKRLHADVQLFFLLGADQFRMLETWREPDEVARLAQLVVFARAGEEIGPNRYSGIQVAVSRVDVSGTEIRRRIREGRSIRYYVPEAVRGIIEGEGLYR